MEYLLSKENLKVLESFCLADTLFAFDYDGTLAPICQDPEKAFMKPALSRLLGELNDLSAVAILTGRSVESVSSFLPVRPAFIIGNHGAEGIQNSAELETMQAQCRSWLAELSRSEAILGKMGVMVEDKVYSLSLHYRKAQDPETAKAALLHLVDRFVDCKVSPGKFVINLTPKISVDKGRALDHIIRSNGYRFGVYFGDDQTDEDVFQYHSPRLLTVKVGTEPSKARYFLNRQDEMEEVLKVAVKTISKSKALA